MKKIILAVLMVLGLTTSAVANGMVTIETASNNNITIGVTETELIIIDDVATVYNRFEYPTGPLYVKNGVVVEFNKDGIKAIHYMRNNDSITDVTND